MTLKQSESVVDFCKPTLFLGQVNCTAECSKGVIVYLLEGFER